LLRDRAIQASTPDPAPGPARPPIRLATWAVMYALVLSQDWVTNALRPAEEAYDVFERADWTAPHVVANLGINTLVGIYAAYFVLSQRFRPLRSLWQSLSLTLFVVYVLTALISSAYSPIWALSLVSAGKWLVAIALIAVYGDSLHPTYCWRPALTITLVTLVGGQLAAIGLELWTYGTLELGGSEIYRLAGVEHPVRLGLIGGLSLLMAAFWIFRGGSAVPGLRLAFRWAIGGLGVLIIALTLSRTGLFAAAVACLAALAIARRRIPVILGVVYPILVIVPLLGLLYGTGAVDELIDRYVFRYSREETFTLTGRFEVWEEAAALIADRPLRGYGYVAGPRVQLARRLPAWSPMHAHNAWLQAALDVGLIGAGAFMLSALGFLGLSLGGLRSHVGRNTRGDVCGCQLMGALLVIALAVASIAEPVFASGAAGIGVLWLLGGAILGMGRSCRVGTDAAAARSRLAVGVGARSGPGAPRSF
jgi:O-antigen ligase